MSSVEALRLRVLVKGSREGGSAIYSRARSLNVRATQVGRRRGEQLGLGLELESGSVDRVRGGG